MSASTGMLERSAFLALAACLSLIQLTIVGGESVCGTIAGLLWVILAVQEGQRPAVPAFFVPLLALAGWTLVSTAASANVLASLREDKQLLLYLIVPATMRLARGPRATTVVTAMIGVGALGAMVGVVQFVLLGYDNLSHRPHGLLGHYMTYSGVLLLIICAAVAQLIYKGREWGWSAVAVPALLVALGLSLTRNAWIGAGCGIVLLLVLRRRRLLVLVPVLIAVALLVPAVRSRAWSIFDPHDPTNRDRISMLKSGIAMIEDHPLLGVGPNMVPSVYLAHYKRADAVDPVDQPGSTRQHLHNVPIQLAAERGLPALACWLWFVVVAARDLLRLLRSQTAPALAAGGLAALVAMLTAGLFEHNFGDSEVLIVLLGLLTLPFAAAAEQPATGPVPVPAIRRPPEPALSAHRS